MQKQADIWKPALISGAIFGFLSGVPYLGQLLNCACCSLVIGAGVLSSYLVIKNSLEPVAYGRAALAGLLAALIALPVAWIMQAMFIFATPGSFTEGFRQSLDDAASVSPELAESAEIVENMGLPVILLFIGFFQMILFAIFGSLGGVIGRAIFERRSDVPPAAPMPGAGSIEPGSSPPPAPHS